MKTKSIILLVVLNILLCSYTFAQGFLYVSVDNDTQKPNGATKTSNQAINNVFAAYGVTDYYQSFPNAKNPELASFYEIHANGDITALESQLKSQKYFKNVYFCPNYELACDNPVGINDTWLVQGWVNNTALTFLNAECAWSITTGSRDIIVGVVDTEFELTHEDMVNTFDGAVGTRNHSQNHGTNVSSCVAAGTNNNKGIASIGYNTRVRGYYVGNEISVFSGVWRAYQDGLRIINVSWTGIGSYPVVLAIKEMTENGTVIVLGAGNDVIPQHLTQNHQNYADIPGVINVSGIDQNNYHGPTGHARNRWIDVCALSIDVASCKVGNTYTGSGGTSFAAPQVAGVVALMRSVNNWLSPAQIEYIIKATTDPINDASQFIDSQGYSLIGTGRVNAYKAVKAAKEAALSGNIRVVMDNNQTWGGKRDVFGDVVVPSGKTLTIIGEIKMSNNARIIVERGGRLVVNGGTLKNLEQGQMWKGIEVWGNQGSTTEPYGILTLTNATIENAEFGVLLAKRDPYMSNIDPMLTGINSSYSGGRITANNTNFINNQCAVGFYTYSRSNTSSFENCSFKITSPVLNIKESLVYMNGTNGVMFKGCSFSVKEGCINSTIKGLYTINSSYKLYPRCTHSSFGSSHLTPFCSNPESGNYSSFDNLTYGIYSIGTSGTTPYNIRFTKFTNNNRSIYSSGIDNVIITDCIIEVPENTSEIGGIASSSTSNYGIYINGSTGYQIEGNNLTGIVKGAFLQTSNHKRGTYGIIINNSGGAANRVYNNDLSRLEVGAQAQGSNRNSTTGVGLCFSCNDFSYNATDIAVMASTVSNANSIARYQYNGNRPAANGFTWDTYSGHVWDMYCYPGGPLIDYSTFKVNGNGKKYIMTKYTLVNYNATTGIRQNITDQLASADNTECPRTSYFVTPTDFSTIQGGSEIVLGRMKSEIDGGNTDQLITTIANATQNDSNELNENLLAISPYMSNEAVGAAVENEDAVSNTMVRDLMVGNNHAARDPEVMDKVDARANPLPGYMYDQIDYAAVNGVSALDRLRAELQSSLVDYTNIFSVVANNMLDSDSIAEWESLMEGSIDNDTRYGYAVYSALKGDIVKANTILSTFEDLDQDCLDFISVMVSDSISYGRITEAGVSALMSIADNDNRVGVLANNILSGFGYTNYEEPIYQVGDFKSNIDKPKRRIAEDVADNLVLYPNPAKDYLTVEYNAEGLGNDLTMTITDIDGKQVGVEKLRYTRDIKKVDIKRLVSGSYVLNILSEGKIVYSKKFVVK